MEERTLKVLPKKEDGKQSVFKDVPKNHWSEDAINDLAKKVWLTDMVMEDLDLETM